MSLGSKIVTLSDGSKVWTRKVGDAPIKVLLLHGGPGMTHEYFESFEQYIDPTKVEFYYHEQLGSYYSDQPDDEGLWEIPRFVEEVETVRQALGLDDFYLLGQSWGGIVAIEYALAYQQHLCGLVISNMVDSITAYADYVNALRELALPAQDVETMKRCEEQDDLEAPEYVDLCMKFYEYCICRKVPWPDAVQRTFAHLNEQVYVTLQGPNEFTITGSLKTWDVSEQLASITVPTLILGAKYDSMNPEVIESMAKRMPSAESYICPEGSHFSMWDDPEHYFAALNGFITR